MLNNKLLGAILLVAGTSIGAGMLALPLTSVRLGFIASSAIMLIMCFLMLLAAIQICNIYEIIGSTGSGATIANKFLGKYGYILYLLAEIALFYSLLSAYISGTTDVANIILSKSLSLNINYYLLQFCIVALLSLILLGKVERVQKFNQALFALKVIFFICLIYILSPHVHNANIRVLSLQQDNLMTFIPIAFTAFGFHGGINVIANYLGIESKKTIHQAFIYGSLLTVAFYIIWLYIGLGALEPSAKAQLASQKLSLPLFIEYLSRATESDYLPMISNNFSIFAIITSFLGVGIGLFDSFETNFKKYLPKSGHVCALTVIPPYLVVLIFPDIFVSALSFAAIFLAIIAIIIPSFVMIKISQKLSQQLTAYLLLLFAILVIVIGLI